MLTAAAIAFDFDGVLVDSNAVKRSAYFEIFATFDGGAAAVADALRDPGDADRFGVIANALARLEGDARPDAESELVTTLAARYNDICERHARACAEIPGVTPTLSALADTFPLYINSATPEEPLRRIVRHRGWADWFKGVFGRPRTKEENLHRILQQEQVAPSALVFVGDGPGDLASALEVGCRFIGVRDDTGEFAARGVTSIPDLHGLPALVRAASASGAAAC